MLHTCGIKMFVNIWSDLRKINLLTLVLSSKFPDIYLLKIFPHLNINSLYKLIYCQSLYLTSSPSGMSL